MSTLAPAPGPYEPCPCGSGRKVRFCCLVKKGPRRGELHKEPLGSLVKQGNPESRQEGCYAAPLGGCGGGLSGEHYFSKSLLVQLPKILVSGLPGIPPGETRPRGINSLASNVLCVEHNSTLSPLDVVMGRVFAAFKGLDQSEAGEGTANHYLFNGHDVERMLMKAMLGYMASGAAPDRGRRIRPQGEYELALLENLFRGTRLPKRAGLYFTEPRGGRIKTGSVTFDPHLKDVPPDEVHIAGQRVGFNGFDFSLFLEDPNLFRGVKFSDDFYRPRQVQILRGGEWRVIEFSWSDGHKEPIVRLGPDHSHFGRREAHQGPQAAPR